VPAGGKGVLRFEYADDEVAAEKSFAFDAQSSLVVLQVAVTRAGKPVPVRVVFGPGIGNPTAAEMELQGYRAPDAVALSAGAVARTATEKLVQTQPLGVAQWAGVESHYFAGLLVPAVPAPVEVRPVALPPLEDGKARPAALLAMDLGPAPGPVSIYVGVKDYDALTKGGHDLSRVVLYQLGDWIGPSIVVPLMRLVRRVHDRIGNWGWAIVAATVFINLVMAPLRHYSIANGLKMAKISPELRAIQERYRKVPLLDPKRQNMQDEMAALYAKNGLNMGTQMMVGCFPMLLTMPFLIAFYRVLSNAVDLRGAPFLWIADLSQKDPLFLTPVLMGTSMFAMQRMTPTAMDPAQQRMMMLMPLMFAGMLLWAPAGLNLYWLSSNVCAILQQTVTYAILNRKGETIPARGRS
jgi:YidC/Oxa1 family membrane protein insertase